MSFFGELGRRNVFRVGIAYAIIAWLVVQVADIVFETIGAPAWVMQTLMLGLVLGFFVALIFSWAYEVTPEGVKRESEVDRSQSITGHTAHKLDRVITGLLVLALGYFIWESRFAEPDAVPTADPVAVTTEDTQPVEETVTPVSDLSIAVLPFDNRSNLADDEFFTEGMHDDLLTTLAKIGSMKVISRTSVMEYKDTTKKIPEIAEELGVANILEGGVQRAGNKVRINVQLIDANTDEHLWAEIYDRELSAENLFAIQSEISRAIADALHATLSPEEEQRIATAPTDNLEAFDHYLRGRQLMATRQVPKLEQATQEFLDAVALDPDFALAWVGVADSHSLLEGYATLPDGTFRDIRMNAIERALAVDNRLGEAYASLGAVYVDDNEPGMAEEAFRKSIEFSPNYATAYHWFSNLLNDSVLRVPEALAYAQRAAELDPRSGIILSNLAGNVSDIGDYRGALRHARRMVETHPDFAHSYASAGEALLYLGDYAGSTASYLKALDVDDSYFYAYLNSVYMYAMLGAQDEMTQFIEDRGDADSDVYQLTELGASAVFGADPRTRDVVTDVLANTTDLFTARQAGWAAFYNGEYDLALEAFLQSDLGDLATAEFDISWISQNSFAACELAWLLLESDGLEDQGARLLSATFDFHADHFPEEVRHQDSWPLDTCHLLNGDTDAALDVIEQQLAHHHIWNWRWNHLLPAYGTIREHPRYVAAWEEHDRRMAEQLEELRAKDGAKPAFEF